ncbi:MAG: class I SAM-dependent methyltransferase [Deltaproteobacteria bacterium]|nr:class I SAM-dependent methyltransferase [Deltaproteobacteria bacterium]
MSFVSRLSVAAIVMLLGTSELCAGVSPKEVTGSKRAPAFSHCAREINRHVVPFYEMLARSGRGPAALAEFAQLSGVYDPKTGACPDLDMANLILDGMSERELGLLKSMTLLSPVAKLKQLSAALDAAVAEPRIDERIAQWRAGRLFDPTRLLGSHAVLDIGIGFGRVVKRLLTSTVPTTDVHVIESAPTLADVFWQQIKRQFPDRTNVHLIKENFLTLSETYKERFGIIYWLWNGPVEFNTTERARFFAKAYEALATPGVLIADLDEQRLPPDDKGTDSEEKDADAVLILEIPKKKSLMRAAAHAGFMPFFVKPYISTQGQLKTLLFFGKTGNTNGTN